MATPAMDIYIPPSMSYFVKRLSGVSFNTIKVTNLGSTTATCGDTIRIRLPNNAIIDLSSFTMYATATTTGTAPNICCLPRLTQSIISQVRININGQTVSGGNLQEYGVLYNIASRLQQAPHHIKMLNLLHSGEDVPTPTANVAKAIAIDDWFGFLSSLPHYFHTGLVGEMIIEIVLASKTVLPASTTALADALLTLTNIYFTIQTLQFDNDLYSKMLESRLAGGDTLEIGFTDAYSFIKPKSTTIEAQVSSNAITKIFVVPRVNHTTAAELSRAYSITNTPVLGVGQNCLFDIGLGAWNDSETTISTACVTQFKTATNTMQWFVDNRPIPSSGPATLPECYQMLLDCMGDRASTMSSNSLLQEPLELLPWTTVFPLASGKKLIQATKLDADTIQSTCGGAVLTTAFPTDTYIIRKLAPEYLYLRKNAIFALNLEMNEGNDQRLISGFSSIGKNCVLRCDLTSIINGTLKGDVDLSMFVLVKKCLKIRAGQQIFVDI